MNTLEVIKDRLEKNRISYKEFRHRPVRTSEEAQRERPDYSLSQGAKAILISAKLKSGEKKYFMLVLPGNRRIDSKKVRKLLKCSKFSFASEDEVLEITEGVLPGGVPPFGNIFNLDVYVDESLSKNDEIIFNAGDRSVSIAMKYEDYKKLSKPHISDFISER
ncbi:hypothetical protein JW766_01700 [Candidatus Dojkabacteria bacterium]|nr:hypothetical protein [Candidatus Dojkabacteria bacterium]